MTRDEYTKFKAREEIAHKILDKINVVESSDIDIIPAIMDFVQTGNIDLFEKYKKFRLATTHEKEELIKKGEEIGTLIQEYKKRQEECVKMLMLYGDSFHRWLKEIRSKLQNDIQTKSYSNLRDMEKVIAKLRDCGKNPYGKPFYVKIGDEVKRINNISLTVDFRVIMETEEDTCFEMPYPDELRTLYREGDPDVITQHITSLREGW